MTIRELYEDLVLVVEDREVPPGFLEGSKFKGVLYHGSSRSGMKVLRPDSGGEYGIYLSPKHRYARMYGSHLYRVLANISRPLFVDGKHEISAVDLTRQDAERLARDGYDSIVSGAQGGDISAADEVVVFDPRKIHVLGER